MQLEERIRQKCAEESKKMSKDFMKDTKSNEILIIILIKKTIKLTK